MQPACALSRNVKRQSFNSAQPGTRSRQGGHVGLGMSNPLGPNHQGMSSSAPSDGSAGLRQTAPMQAMQLPVGSMITDPRILPSSHHSTQTQPHFQSNPRMYQSFTDALTESSQPLSGPSMHSMPSHGPSQGLFSQAQPGQSLSLQPSSGQGLSSQPLQTQGVGLSSQGMSSQPLLGQGPSLQPHTGQAVSLQPLSGHMEGSLGMHGSVGLMPNGIVSGQSLPDGSAQLPAHLQGMTLFFPISNWVLAYSASCMQCHIA